MNLGWTRMDKDAKCARSAGFSPRQRPTVKGRAANTNALEMRTARRRERRAPVQNGGVEK
jgi:hypothetical protein